MRTCRSCKRLFEPSSTHNDCPRCRYQKTKTQLCAICEINVHSFKYNNCRTCTNKLKPNYGTGRYKKNGYVMVFQKGHPRAQGSRHNYVFEHILVMENFIGRYLEKDENVHHKNGVKDDNNINNLELWVRPQPSGIRAKDAVEWAKKILKRYEDTEKNKNGGAAGELPSGSVGLS